MKYPIERGLSKMDEEQILDGLKPICLCKGIRKSVFLKHIAAGRKSVEELQKATGAGSGPCQEGVKKIV
jgi:bacterioferritin-associated ferredoxin